MVYSGPRGGCCCFREEHSCKLNNSAVSTYEDVLTCTRYVAMHSMTEATSGHDETPVNGYIDQGSGKNSLERSDIAIVLSGLLLPLLTQVGHVH